MIFVDTSFIIALLNEKDQWHKKAVQLSEVVKNETAVISDIVLIESMNSLSYLGGKQGKLVYDIINDSFKIKQFNSKKLFDLAMNEFVKYDGTIGFTDCTSIVLMDLFNIIEIYSFDSDFDKVNGIIRIYE